MKIDMAELNLEQAKAGRGESNSVSAVFLSC